MLEPRWTVRLADGPTQFPDAASWQAHLAALGLHTIKVQPDPVRIATEGALWGAVTRSDTGRDCRDAFLSLMKTCDKLGLSFRRYLGDRLQVNAAPVVPPLPQLVRAGTPA